MRMIVPISALKFYTRDRSSRVGANTQSQELITGLLCRDPAMRLGVGGAEEVKASSFFDGLNWDDVYHKRYVPEWRPTLKGVRKLPFALAPTCDPPPKSLLLSGWTASLPPPPRGTLGEDAATASNSLANPVLTLIHSTRSAGARYVVL